MRIAVVNTQAPFVTGGAELHAQRLAEELRLAGHQAELVTMPFSPNSPDAILDQAIAAASLDIGSFFGNSVDLMIGLRFPAYLMRHPNKAVWLLHQHREFYDLWDAGMSGLKLDPRGNTVRQIVTGMDRKALSQARPLFANSANVAGRLKHYNGVAAEALYHPPPLEKSLRPGPAGDYLYFPSRISGLKRQDLVLKALALTRAPVRMVFSGAADSARDGARFRQAIEEHGLAGRVEWRGHVTAAEMIELYAHALGVVFPPFDEDLGYVTLEAMLSEKPVVTTADSGGPLEFVVDGESGFVTEPEPAALARAFDRLAGDRELAARMGKAGRRRYDTLSISWGNVIDRLVTQP